MTSTTNVKADELNYDKYESSIYDNDIIRSIPGHQELHKHIEAVINKKIAENNISKMLELGIGTGLTSETILKIVPNAELTAIDFSEQMINGAKKRLNKYNVKYIIDDFSKIDYKNEFDLVFAVIGIHHQNDEGKILLFKKIFDSLKDKGLFIFGDLFTHQDIHKAAVCDAKHYHHLVENARTEKSLKERAHHHKYLNLLAPIEKQIEWLKAVGFTEIKIEYERFNTALLIAQK